VTDALSELTESLERIVERLRAGDLEPDAVLALVEDCARLATEASAELGQRTRAAVEPLPDLPGQLPLPAG
jgi:exonuclease VII small subunit